MEWLCVCVCESAVLDGMLDVFVLCACVFVLSVDVLCAAVLCGMLDVLDVGA